MKIDHNFTGNTIIQGDTLRVLKTFPDNLFGGVSFNYMMSQGTDNIGLFPETHLWTGHTEKLLQQTYIGYQAGFQVIF